ncbi:uncharacterized protein LOC112573705 [Pomacea canaliculata]|uniref:uncharacterized protein LOC112573705 n=1 Tax=Pomacea canaliculata TaxID=400727 RepID=UPI000D7304A6|nr:uncharacterized protein LOC112573705 [Pomacea canaliculata]
MAKFNISVPGLSFHAEYEASSGRKLDLFINKITIRYYCEPTLGIFYSLHWRPQSAPRNGHLSEYKFKNEGDNLTLVNSMSANYSYAQRYTTLYWTSNVGDPDEKLDVIRMHAEVHNTTTPGMHRYHYKMHLDGSRRSLSSLYKRLDKVERSPATTIETPEVVASRRWAQLTNTFLDWLSEDTQQGGQNKTQAAKATLAAQGDKLQTSEKLFAVPMRIFSRPSWRIEMDARIKTRFRISKEPHGKSGRKVEGFDSTVSVNITMADPRIKIWALNGTLGKGQGMDFNMSAAMSSDLVNFTLLFDAQQRRQWPFFYHFHKWQLADITAHRYDRSFSLLFDLERNDHFNYNLTLVSPRTNVSHAINFSTHSQELRTVQANMYLHSEQPQCDIRYIEASKLTPSGLVTTVDMNSTWLNLDFDMNIDFLTAGAIRGRKRFIIDGKVPFLLGPRQLDIEFSRESRSLPSLLLAYKNVENHTSNVLLQLQSRDAVLVTFSNRMAGAKKNTTSYQWRIHLAEPTVLQNSIEWDPKKSQEVLGAASYILHAGAHSLKVFGQTMALNIHKNITDMIIPFINQTVSEVVDRITKAKMKQVAEQGLDPRQHVPLLVKVMKGGLKIVQELQMSWQNSETGQLAESLGVHSVVSYAILATSGLPSFILKGQPFFIRQYINFRIRPTLKEIASSGRFNFSIVLPFVWDSIVSMPRTRMLIRQTLWWKQLLTIGSKADLPFIAIVPANRVQMFDVFTQDIAVPAQSNCTYLLSTNFDTGNYSILLSHEGITMVTQTTGLTLATDGRLTSLDRNKELSQVPAALGDMEVTLEAGQVIVRVTPSSARDC